MKKPLLVGLIFLLALAGCSSKEERGTASGKSELTVSAAASLQDALTDIKASYEKKHPNVTIHYNFGGSGALEQQISQGAPVDLFFSAAEDRFEALVEEGLIDQEEGTDLVSNELVLVVPKGSASGIQSFEDLPKAGKLAIGIPESVPAGKYGKETLESLAVWKVVERNVVYAKDVRQVLTYVETGNVDAGIVYKTDALISKKVEIVATAGEDTHAPIIYPVGLIKNSANRKEAQKFYDFLQQEESLNLLEKYGFKGMD